MPQTVEAMEVVRINALRAARQDGGGVASTAPELGPVEASETAVAEEEPRQPYKIACFCPPLRERPCTLAYTSPETLEAILEAVVSHAVPIRAEPGTEPFEREFHAWEDDERRRLEVDTNSPRYISRLLNLYRQGLFEPIQADLHWDREGRPSLVALAGYSKAPLNLRGWMRRARPLSGPGRG